MSLMSLGFKMTALKYEIKKCKLTTKEQVKHAAKELNIASTIGYENLSPEDKEAWYEQLAINVFENHNNCIPCFVDIGFGKELLERSSGMWNYNVPKKQHWKIVVTRDKYPDWQFNAIVHSFTREEAVSILKAYFTDFGKLGFNYDDPIPKTEHKAPWVEINNKKNKIKSYKEYVEVKEKESSENEK